MFWLQLPFNFQIISCLIMNIFSYFPGRELSYVLLTGILLCFINTFLLLAKPCITSCILQRFGVGLGFSVVYGALLTKTNRIFRIFRLASMSAARPNFVSPRSQLFITFSIVGVQVFATIIWCIVHHPGSRNKTPEYL